MKIIKFFDSLSSNQRFVANIFIPFLYFVPLGVAYFSDKNFGFSYRGLVYSGLSVGAFGMILWMLSTLNLGSEFSTLPGAKKLVQRGVYRFIRHPMYLGIALAVFGLMLACGSIFGMIYLFIVILPVNILRSRIEEKVLEELFGQVFEEYKKSTWF